MDRLRELLQRVVYDERLPGVVAAVAVDGVVSTVSIGDIAIDLPLRLSSMMKPFTAAAVLQLDLDLDEPVAPHLRSIEVDPRVTARHLFTHTSGLVRPGFFHVDDGEQRPTLPEFYAAVPLTCSFEPGSAMAYSNHGYAVLGQLVEDVTGEPFADRLQRAVLDPLSITIDVSETTRHQLGYDADGVVPNYLPVLTPASGGWCTVTDVLRLPLGLVTILAPAAVELLAQNASPAGMQPRGLGWLVTDDVLWHSGGWPGASGTVAWSPTEGIAAAVMMNMSAEARSDLGPRVIGAVTGKP